MAVPELDVKPGPAAPKGVTAFLLESDLRSCVALPAIDGDNHTVTIECRPGLVPGSVVFAISAPRLLQQLLDWLHCNADGKALLGLCNQAITESRHCNPPLREALRAAAEYVGGFYTAQAHRSPWRIVAPSARGRDVHVSAFRCALPGAGPRGTAVNAQAVSVVINAQAVLHHARSGVPGPLSRFMLMYCGPGSSIDLAAVYGDGESSQWAGHAGAALQNWAPTVDLCWAGSVLECGSGSGSWVLFSWDVELHTRLKDMFVAYCDRVYKHLGIVASGSPVSTVILAEIVPCEDTVLLLPGLRPVLRCCTPDRLAVDLAAGFRRSGTLPDMELTVSQYQSLECWLPVDIPQLQFRRSRWLLVAVSDASRLSAAQYASYEDRGTVSSFRIVVVDDAVPAKRVLEVDCCLWSSCEGLVSTSCELAPQPHVSLALGLAPATFPVTFPVAIAAFGTQLVLSATHTSELDTMVSRVGVDATVGVLPLVYQAICLMHGACVSWEVWFPSISSKGAQSRLGFLLEHMSVEEAALTVVSVSGAGDAASACGSFDRTRESQILHISLSTFVERMADRLSPEDCIVVWLCAHWAAMCRGAFPLGHPDRVGYGDVTERVAKPEKLGSGLVYYVTPGSSSSESSARSMVKSIIEEPAGDRILFHATSHSGACNILRVGINPSAGEPFRKRDFGQAFYLNPNLNDAVEWAFREYVGDSAPWIVVLACCIHFVDVVCAALLCPGTLPSLLFLCTTRRGCGTWTAGLAMLTCVLKESLTSGCKLSCTSGSLFGLRL